MKQRILGGLVSWRETFFVVKLMDKEQVAAILAEIGTLLELQGENPFRCLAYHNASRAILQISGKLTDLVAAGKLQEIPGIGETLQEKIATLVTTGQLPFYDDLRAKIPSSLVQLLRLPGVGPKKVKALYDSLGIDDLEKLKAACDSGQVASLKGFGVKTQQKILEGIAFLGQTGQRFRLDQALAIAESLLSGLQECPHIIRMELCGSLRRRKETIQDIDILVSSNKPALVMDRFISLPGVNQIIGHGETKSSIIVDRGTHENRRLIMNADLRVVEDSQFPFALNYFTGSKEHNVTLRGRAQQYGLKLNEYELAAAKGPIHCQEEADIYRNLDLDYIPPELREQTGEIEAAALHQLPQLIQRGDLTGTFHCHTNWSDGRGTLEEMVEAAHQLGFEYLGIADHSQSLTVAQGLAPERVQQQQQEIDALNSRFQGIRIFKGTECDILPDGRLDFDDQLLASFDYVVASVHTHFNLSEEEMTKRMVKAISHARVTILGHATGRLLLRREGYKVDREAVLQAAAKHGTLIEINAHPQRLDIDWLWCKRAKQLGVKMVIDPDAHGPQEIAYVDFGIDVARRGWLERKDILNTLPVVAVAKELEARRQEAETKETN
jgi:DNA polymerase (family 10)